MIRPNAIAGLLTLAVSAVLIQGCDAGSPLASPDGAPLDASAPGTFAPPPPVGFSAGFRADSFAVELGWTHDGTQLASQWRLERREAAESAWTTVAADSGVGGRWLDGSFAVGTARTLEYRVLVCNAAGCGASVTSAVEIPALPAPASFTAVAGADGITLAWEHDAPGDWIYQVLRRTASTGFAPRVTTAPGAESFLDTKVSQGETYYYQVRALVPGTPPAGRYRHSPWSQEASATPGASGAGGAPVARADSSRVTGPDAATLYGAVTPNGKATTVRFQWSTTPDLAGAPMTPAADAGSGFAAVTATATLSGLTPGLRYYYRVIAANAAGADSSAVLPAELAPPPAPRVQAAFTRPAYEVALSWSGTAADRFRVERRGAGEAGWTLLADNYQNSWLNDNSFHLDSVYRFEYRVTACNVIGCNTGYVSTFTQLLPPPARVAARVPGVEVRLEWDLNGAPASVFYQIRRRTPGTAYAPRVTTGPNATTFTDTRVEADSTYLYEIRALLPVPGESRNRRSAWVGPLAVTVGIQGSTPVVTTDSSHVYPSVTELFGTVELRSSNTRVYFEVSRYPGMDSLSAYPVTLPSTELGVYRVKVRVSGTTPLYYRLAARSGAGTARGAIRAATAPDIPPPPAVQGRFDGAAYAVELRWMGAPGVTYVVTRVDPADRTRNYRVGEASDSGIVFRDVSFGVQQSRVLTYVVRACAASGCGAPSDSVRVAADALGAPGGLEATALDSTRIQLRWDDHATGESGFIVERRDPGSTRFARVTKVRTNGATSYLDVVSPGTYTYRVRAYLDEDTRQSANSNEVTVTAPPAGGENPPTVTTGGTTFAVVSGSVKPTLTGTVDPNGRLATVWFELSTSSSMTDADSIGAGTHSGTEPAQASVTVSGLTRGTTYYYRVAASSDEGTAAGAVRTFLFDTPPAPQNLQVTFRQSAWDFTIAYTPGSAVVSSLDVEVDDNPMFAPYLAPILTTERAVQVDVRLCNVFGCGPTGTMLPTVPAFPPPTFTATGSGGQVDLAWADQSGVGFKVWHLSRRPVGTTTWTLIFGTSQATSYVDTNVNGDVEYRLLERIDAGDSGDDYRTAATVIRSVTGP